MHTNKYITQHKKQQIQNMWP